MTATRPTPTERRFLWPDWDRVTLSQTQYDYYRDPHPYLILNAGRYFGKDWITLRKGFAELFALYAQRASDPTFDRDGPKASLILVAPVSNNFDDLWRRIRDVLPPIPGVAPDGAENVRFYEKDNSIEIFGKGGILITCFSTYKPDSIRGQGCDILLVTEAAYLDQKIFDLVLLPLCERAGYAGLIRLNSTPRNNWWDRAVDNSKRQHGWWAGWHVYEGTSFDNPKLTRKEFQGILAVREKNVYQYRREFLAELFIDVPDDALLDPSQHRAFSPELVGSILVSQRVRHQPPYYIGVDLATTGRDKLAVVVIDRDGLICHVEVHSKTGIEEIVDLFERLQADWRPIAFTFDATGPIGKRCEGRLRNIRANPVTVGKDKEDLVKHLEQHMVHRSVSLPNPDSYDFANTHKYYRANVQLLLRELRSYRRYELIKERASNQVVRRQTYISYSKPPNGSDDVLDALVMALHPRRVPVPVTSTALSDVAVWG